MTDDGCITYTIMGNVGKEWSIYYSELIQRQDSVERGYVIMLHKYYYSGRSRRNNMQFSSDTADDGVWTMTLMSFWHLLSNSDFDEELDIALKGYKQCLYLEKSENTKRFWKIVIAVWRSKRDCDYGFDPDRVVRVTTDDFCELVPDKHTGMYYEELPMTVFNKFVSSDHRMFY